MTTDIVLVLLSVALTGLIGFVYRQVRELSSKYKKQTGVLLELRKDAELSEATLQRVRSELVAVRAEADELRTQADAREEEITESKALFSTISNVAYDLVFVLNEDHDVIAVNKSAALIFGDRNPIGEKLSDVIVSPELDNLVERAMDEAEHLEEQIVINDNFFRSRTQVMRYDDDRVFIGVALQDITQLVRLNRARRDMVANISHELRTPIANIRLTIDSLFYDQDRPKRKASIASLRDIARETDSLLWLVQELLDLSMIESGQAILKLVEVPLTEIVQTAVERMQDQLNSKEMQIARHIPDQMNVLCDPDQARRVLTNLIHNAIKWSPEGGNITISAMAEGDETVIQVLDNGPGVPDDKVDRIFERFYQVDASRTGNEGTGLGLAICKHIITAHGGRIWAEGNSLGTGGRFMFTLLSANAQDNPSANDDTVTTGAEITDELNPFTSH